MATSMISPSLLAKQSSCIPRTDPLCGVVNKISTTIPKLTLNQPEIEWSMLPTLYEGSGDHYEVESLMTPKTITLWTQTRQHHGKQFKVVQ
jgi:hypothetical protein